MALDFGFVLSLDSRIGEYTMKKRILALLLVLAMGLSLAACSAPAADSPSPSASVTPSAEPSPSGMPLIKADLTQDVLTFAVGSEVLNGEPLLTINGKALSNNLALYWLFYCCMYYEQQLAPYGMSLDLYAKAIVEEAYSLATYYTVLAQKAEELGCILTDEQMKAIQDNITENQSDYDLSKIMYGLSDEDFLVIYALSDYYENLSDVLIEEPTEEDLNNFVYQAKHILIATAASAADGKVTLKTGATVDFDGTAEEYNAEALARAESILAEIRGSDDVAATFDTLMHEHSEDGRDASGNLGAPDGYTATPGKMVPEFEKTAFATGIGEVSDVVESSYGYHIILRGEVKDINNYAEQWLAAEMDKLLAQWVQESEIVTSEAINSDNLVEFYNRFYAWQSDYISQMTKEK